MANIGIDLDDVVADFMSVFSKICYRLFGKPEPGLLPVDWEWSNFHLTNDQIEIAWKEAKRTYNFWEFLPIEEGVDGKLLWDMENEHNVFFITARVPSNGASIKDQSCSWLRDNIGIDYPVVFVTYNKGPLAAALQLDYFIDDRPKNVLEIKKAVPTCRVFLKDSSHNQAFNDPDIPRIKDLNEFMKIVKEASVLTR
jgi:uncharacterized HAD superfamily protein